MKKRFSVYYRIILLLLISLAAVHLITNCKKKKLYSTPVLGPASGDTPAGGGETQQLKLVAEPSETGTVNTSGQAQIAIIAFVENKFGQPMPDGTKVVWTATVGDLDPNPSTAASGIATTTLTFPAYYTGCSLVTAISGDATGNIFVCADLVDATIMLIVESDDDVIAYNGQTTIMATVTEYGVAKEGTLVEFEIISGSEYAVLTNSGAVTDASGKASITLKGYNSSESDQTVILQAKLPNGMTAQVSLIVKQAATTTTTTTEETTTTTTTTTTTEEEEEEEAVVEEEWVLVAMGSIR